MPKVEEVPKGLKPYKFLGMDITVKGSQATADCPFCGREGKFSIELETGEAHCWLCEVNPDAPKGGVNPLSFVRRLWEESDARTNGGTKGLAADRKLLYPETLTHWGAVESIIDKAWLIPGYSADGKLTQLYKRIRTSERWELRPTPGIGGHAIHGVPLYDKAKPLIYLCEGPWDAMALWETLGFAKKVDGELAVTAAEKASIRAIANVLAVPNCGAVGDPFKRWLPLFAGRDVVLCFDSDHPTQAGAEPAGYAASKRAAALLASVVSGLPKSISWVKWGKGGFDSKLPEGWDVRDELAQASEVKGRVKRLESLLERVEEVPEAWLDKKTVAAVVGKKQELEPLACRDWRTLTDAWRSAMKWTPGLDRALSVMMASVLSTETIGEQLWVKIIAPPSAGKSTLCEAFAVAKKYVLSKSTIRGFHSGYKTDKDGDEDHSLIPKIKGKTLIIKDGDTLLKSPNRDQILSEARDLFDGTSRAHYRQGVDRDYEDIRMTWILCGTSGLRELDASELGARFLDCSIMDAIDPEFEREVNLRVVHRALRNAKVISNGRADTRLDVDMALAKRLTGGYVEYLRENASALMTKVEVDDEQAMRIINLGEFVAMVRARPSKKQEEIVEREFSSRLVEQYARLTSCLAAVLGRFVVDDEVMRRVKAVAMDTARGRTLTIINRIYAAGELGVSVRGLAAKTGWSEDKERTLLGFLRWIGACEPFNRKQNNITGPQRWRLTGRMETLYEEVFGAENQV